MKNVVILSLGGEQLFRQELEKRQQCKHPPIYVILNPPGMPTSLANQKGFEWEFSCIKTADLFFSQNFQRFVLMATSPFIMCPQDHAPRHSIISSFEKHLFPRTSLDVSFSIAQLCQMLPRLFLNMDVQPWARKHVSSMLFPEVTGLVLGSLIFLSYSSLHVHAFTIS